VKKALVLGVVVASVLLVAVLALRHIDNYADFWRMRETPGVRPHEQPLLIMEEGLVPVSAAEAMIRATRAQITPGPQRPHCHRGGEEIVF
jgi:hypothetical protein